jgi:multidrug efflux pump subunit AcrA (membrane-fusion protein)/YHS domain-containing protein
MKKMLYAVFILVLLLGSFLIGSWYSQRGRINTGLSSLKSPGVSTEQRTDTDTDTDTSSLSPGTVRITPQKQQMIGVRVEKVERAFQKYALRTLGRVAADENRTYRVVSSAEGWVSDIRESTTGSLVKKDQLMAKVYNYQFLTRQQQYLYALEFEERRQRTRIQASNPPSPDAQSPVGQQPKEQQPGAREQTLPSGTYSMIPATPGGEANMSGRAVYSIRDQLEVAKLELYSLGVGDYQIQEITRTKRLVSDIEIRSPVTGIVLSRNVSPQQRFDRGVELYRIADLSRVWIIADVYGGEEKYIKPGMSAKVSLPDEEKVFKAKVTDVPPPFDTTSRALKVRLETDNPGNVLRPDMFVDVEFLITFPPAISVPADAVLDSGLKRVVFVDLGNGLFEPREVETGWRFGNRVEIAKGLKPGEQIAMSGTFLIDSESRLELAAAGMIGTLSKDPVCGVDVSLSKAEKAGRKSTYRGKTYYFTSDECKGQFDKNPKHYVKE